MGGSPTNVPKKEDAVDAEIVKKEVEVAETEKPSITPDDAGLRPDGWEGVIWDCERAFGCPDHCKTPEESAIPSLIAELKEKHKNLAIDMINLVKPHLS